MANPQPHFPPYPYPHQPPQHSPPLPHAGAYPPPNKKPRLSPNPPSPYSSPQMTNGAIPNPGFSNLYYTAQPNGVQPQRPAEFPQSVQTSTPTQGNMGPPLRPADERPVDITELQDVLSGSGINLKDEEDALISRNNTTVQRGHPSFTSDPTASFNSVGSASSQNGYVDTYYAHQNTLSPNMPGLSTSFYGGGTYNQSPTTVETVEQQAERMRRRELRFRNEARQYHLNDPFVQTGTVWGKVTKKCQSQQVKISDNGILTSNNPRSLETTTLNLHGPDNHARLVVLKGQPLLSHASVPAEFLALLSLAAKDRVRSLLEDSATLARGRRESSNGMVPVNLVSIAVGNGEPTETTVTPAAKFTSLKRPHAEVESNELPSPVLTEPPTSQQTIAYPNTTMLILREHAQAERVAEEARAAKRLKRNAEGLLTGDVSRSGSVSTPGPSTPGPIGEKAPEPAPQKSLTKKELKKQQDAKVSEAQQHAATNNASNLALGGAFRVGKKKISWMTQKTPLANPGFMPPKAAGTAQATRATGGSVGASSAVQSGKWLGDFREDGENGSGIQLRDVVATLEYELKEKRAISRAMGKMGFRP